MAKRKRIDPKEVQQIMFDIGCAVAGLNSIRNLANLAIGNDANIDRDCCLEALADIARWHGKRLDAYAGTDYFDTHI